MPKKFIERKFTVTAFFSSLNFSWNKDFVFNGESHEMWEIVYILSGKVEVTENEKIYLLEKNNMIIHAPWEFHRIKSADGTSPSLRVTRFRCSLFSPLSHSLFPPPAAVALQAHDLPRQSHSRLLSPALTRLGRLLALCRQP